MVSKCNTRRRVNGLAIALSSALLISGAAGLTTIVSAADQSSENKNQPKSNRYNVNVQPVSKKQKQLNADTAKAVNRINGTNLKSSDLQPPEPEKPIHGFHPIKKMLRPIKQLEKNSVALQQQIMRLEGPIAGLQGPMVGLHKKMTTVEKKMDTVDSHMNNMHTQLGSVEQEVRNVNNQVSAVRGDIAGMRKQIGQLEVPIQQLQKPLHDLRGPLTGVAKPLTEVQSEIRDVKALLASILFGIMVAAIAIAIGTPIAAIMVYRNRHKLFPDMRESDLPTIRPESGTRSDTRAHAHSAR